MSAPGLILWISVLAMHCPAPASVVDEPSWKAGFSPDTGLVMYAAPFADPGVTSSLRRTGQRNQAAAAASSLPIPLLTSLSPAVIVSDVYRSSGSRCCRRLRAPPLD